jgi:hypothetical protein
MGRATLGDSIARVGRKWHAKCGARKIPLEVVRPQERDRVLANAKYEPAPWKRQAHVLARDSHGNYYYYYADRYQRELGGKHYRVFVGRRG